MQKYAIIKPCKMLRQFVQYYWGLELETPKIYAPYRVIPYGCVEIMFYYGDQYKRCSTTDTMNDYFQPNATIAGQQRKYYDLLPTGKIGLFAIQFKPHGAKMFFNIPMYELKDYIVGLEDIHITGINSIVEKIISAPSIAQKVDAIEAFLITQLVEKEYFNFNRINSVVGKIIETKGDIPIDALTKIACLSNKQFDRVFSRFIGLSPKQYLSIIRFQKILNTKQVFPDMSYTNLALECGYYDQAHFIHDFKRITGLTPKEYFKAGCAYSDLFTF